MWHFPATKKYFGISLKKKPKPTSPDPTLINKAFDTVLQGNKFDSIKEELTSVRIEYFAGQVRQAHEDGILYIPNINSLSDEELLSLTKNSIHYSFCEKKQKINYSIN